ISHAQRGLLQHVAPDDPEIATAAGNQARNVVVAHQQQVDGQVLAEAEQLVAATPETHAATRQQVQPGLAETAALLRGDTQTIAWFHDAGFFFPAPRAVALTALR